jgi:serine/threonine protein kinase
VYALGVLLYLLFTGRLPFIGDSEADLVRQIVHERPPRPSDLCPLDSQIEDVILTAMQPDPRARFETITEMLGALSPCLDGQLGGYGQQDVASFVARFADDDEGEPPIDVYSEDMHSFDVDVESSVLEIPREPSRPVRMPRAPTASTRLIALDRSIKAPPVFKNAEVGEDSRSTVQSLFGSRPAYTGEHTRLFDSYTRADAHRISGGDEPRANVWPWPTSRTK